MATTPDTDVALSPLTKEEKKDWKRLQRVVSKGIDGQWEWVPHYWKSTSGNCTARSTRSLGTTSEINTKYRSPEGIN